MIFPMFQNKYRSVLQPWRCRPCLKKRYLYYLLSCMSLILLFIIGRKIGKSFRGHSLIVNLREFNSVKIYYDEIKPEMIKSLREWTTVVLLYESSMNTNPWESVGTPELLLAAGYRVITMHLPVLFPNTAATPWPSHPLKGEILSIALEKLDALTSVLVVPSRTGSYGLPVVVRGGLKLKAFVAISPWDSHQFTAKEYQIMKTPTLIVYGTKDNTLGAAALEHLKMIPNKEIVEIPNAGHFCYVDQTEYFHKMLLNFLESL